MNAIATARYFAAVRVVALAIGAGGGFACVVAAWLPENRGAFFSAYLYAYLFWLGVSLGSLALILLHNLTGGEWGVVIRRIAEPAARLLPLMLVLFIPVLLGMRELFPWARPGDVAGSEILRHRSAYLNVPFFMLRAAIYFVAWIALESIVRMLGKVFVARPNELSRSRLRGWSAAGLIIYLMTMTHAGYDWAMSRDTDFYSTTFGFIITVGQTLSALAFAILVVACVYNGLPLLLRDSLNKRPEQNPPEAGAPNVLNDVGNILLTLVILWAYVSFMQLLVIWMGNSSEDNGYYLKRGLGQPSVWRWIGLSLVILHFFIPFCLLLFRGTKKYLAALAVIAAVVFAAHLLEQYWLIAPRPDLKGPHFAARWMDFLTPLGIGGFWMTGFLMLLPGSLAAVDSGAHPMGVATSSGLSGEEGPNHV